MVSLPRLHPEMVCPRDLAQNGAASRSRQRRPVRRSGSPRCNGEPNQLAASGTVSYAHLGANDEDGLAAFLDESYELVCPMFHQYVSTPDLDALLGCIEDREPELVVVTPSLRRRRYTQRTLGSSCDVEGTLIA
jgi:hypothetical protein